MLRRSVVGHQSQRSHPWHRCQSVVRERPASRTGDNQSQHPTAFTRRGSGVQISRSPTRNPQVRRPGGFFLPEPLTPICASVYDGAMSENPICQECHMNVGPGVVYHPHLYCVIWKAYHRDPAEILAEHGFVREPVTTDA